jgi:hypothetical protein
MTDKPDNEKGRALNEKENPPGFISGPGFSMFCPISRKGI